MRLNDRGVQALSAAIIVQGIRDYNYCRNAVATNRRGEKQDGDRCYEPEARLYELEKFFRGRWFGVLSDEMDGEHLLSILKGMPSSRLISYSGWMKGRCRDKGASRKSWAKLGMHPTLQKRLWEHRISQTDICREIGADNSTVACWLKKGLKPDQLGKIAEAAERIIKRRATP